VLFARAGAVAAVDAGVFLNRLLEATGGVVTAVVVAAGTGVAAVGVAVISALDGAAKAADFWNRPPGAVVTLLVLPLAMLLVLLLLLL
jgi:hypothetical protein